MCICSDFAVLMRTFGLVERLHGFAKIEAVRKIDNKHANGYSGAVGLTLFKTTKKLICLFDTVKG